MNQAESLNEITTERMAQETAIKGVELFVDRALLAGAATDPTAALEAEPSFEEIAAAMKAGDPITQIACSPANFARLTAGLETVKGMSEVGGIKFVCSQALSDAMLLVQYASGKIKPVMTNAAPPPQNRRQRRAAAAQARRRKR